MKKLLSIICAIAALLIMTTTLSAQSEVPDAGTVSTIIVAGGLSSYFVSFAALVPLVVLVSSFVNSKLKIAGFWKQLASWAVSIIICYLGWWFKLGMFENLTVWIVGLYGLGIGLAANGVFDIAFIQSILAGLKLEKQK
jgi:hypothetical protein